MNSIWRCYHRAIHLPKIKKVTENKLQQAADALWLVFESRLPCDPIRELIGEFDVEAAYLVQAINNSRWRAKGAKQKGCKIGLTSLAVQNQLGVNQPDFGLLFDFMELNNGESISMSELIQPKAEAELAFFLAEDLTQDELTEQTVAHAVDYVSAAIEIVGSRVRNWDIRITDTIADNASSSHYVLGDVKKKIHEVDLVGVKMKLYKNGEMVSQGQGSDCLGSPLKSATWLAQTMKQKGLPLKKGDVILTGALGPMCPIAEGDVFFAEIDGFDDVRVKFF